METKRQDIEMDIDENKKDTQNKTNTVNISIPPYSIFLL